MNEESRPKAAPMTDGEKVGTHNTAPWEPTAWFRGELDRIKAKARAAVPRDGITTVVVVALRSSRPGSREDRTCDRCRKYVPPISALFYCGGHPFQIAGNVTGVMTFGLCDRCRRLEGLPEGRMIP